jgi:hypothetical protein
MKVSLTAPPGQSCPFAGWGKPLWVALAAVLAGTLAVGGAQGAGRGGSGGGKSGASGKSGTHHSGKNHSRHHHNNRGAVAAGIFVGGPWWPWWDYPGYYPPVARAAVPVEYIERSEQEKQTANDWLYCAKAQGYFPYVTECAEGWERVPAAPFK